MKPFLLLFLLPFAVFSQSPTNLEAIEPEISYDNVHSQILYENEYSSYYLIWIKEEVKAHKHVKHTESITVVDGYGIMTVGEESFEVKKGDYFVIPKDTYHSLVVKSENPMKVISIQMPKFDPTDRIFKEE